MILLYISLKVADVSLSESGHLVPWCLTSHRLTPYSVVVEDGLAQSLMEEHYEYDDADHVLCVGRMPCLVHHREESASNSLGNRWFAE